MSTVEKSPESISGADGQSSESMSSPNLDTGVIESDGVAIYDDEVAPGAIEASTLSTISARSVRMALTFGLAFVCALTALAGWLGFGVYESQRDHELRQILLQVGRQAALNLTTIDYQHADDNVRRILESATGTFHDDFSSRSKPFIDVIKQAQSKSVGEVTAAGLESATRDEAQVLVAVTVKTSNAGAPEQQPRAWRMRISVQRIGEDVKVANVEFVP